MIPTFLWGWSSSARTSPLRRQLETLQQERRFKMPTICEIPNQTLPIVVAGILNKIFEASGKPNVHIIFLHPNFRMLDLKTVTENFRTIVRAASFHSKTFIVFCDATGSFPDNGTTVLNSEQVNNLLRWVTTQYPLNSFYIDLQQIILHRDWTNHFNLRSPGQVKLGQTIVRALSGTPKEVFEYG